MDSFFFLFLRKADAQVAIPNPRAANGLLAVPVFGKALAFGVTLTCPGCAGCGLGAREWFVALDTDALSDRLVEMLALSLSDTLTDALNEVETLVLK